MHVRVIITIMHAINDVPSDVDVLLRVLKSSKPEIIIDTEVPYFRLQGKCRDLYHIILCYICCIMLCAIGG